MTWPTTEDGPGPELSNNYCDVCGLDYPEWQLEQDDYGEIICRFCRGE